MTLKPTFFLLIAGVVLSIGNSVADENFQLCLNPSYAKGITLKYNGDHSGCVVESHTTQNFQRANQHLHALHSQDDAQVSPESNPPFNAHGINTTTVPSGSNYVPYTVVFESHHKVLGIVARGNCNIRSERSEVAAIDVYKDNQHVTSFSCYHPGDLDNTYCQQSLDSDSVGIAFGKVKPGPTCSADTEIGSTVEVLVYDIVK